MNLSTSPLLRRQGWARFVNRDIVVRLATCVHSQTAGIGRWGRQTCIFLLCALFLFPAGCMRNEPRADLVIINGAEPESLDPAIITGQPDLRVVSAIFEGLTRLDPKTSAPIPSLAERWDISPDSRTYTFHLRPNLVWSTGEPITADDVVYSWIRALNPATASDYAGQLFYLKNGEEFNAGTIKDPSLVGVHAVDRDTVRVDLKNPTAFFSICARSQRWRWCRIRPLRNMATAGSWPSRCR